MAYSYLPRQMSQLQNHVNTQEEIMREAMAMQNVPLFPLTDYEIALQELNAEFPGLRRTIIV